ncbi:MAG: AgmX/PglI C-terminal domain-containing protein [Bdellovibrionales bacterium]|nr:AgmX/PglI C-terminal domain-containing protein [Bdellovibrionales bacterium]
MKLLAIWMGVGVLISASTTSDVRELISSNMEQVQACYEDYLKEKKQDGDLAAAKGKLTISWLTNTKGEASDFKELKSSFDDKYVFSCIAAKMITWKFPPSTNKKGTIYRFPFVFNYKSKPTK